MNPACLVMAAPLILMMQIPGWSVASVVAGTRCSLPRAKPAPPWANPDLANSSLRRPPPATAPSSELALKPFFLVFLFRATDSTISNGRGAKPSRSSKDSNFLARSPRMETRSQAGHPDSSGYMIVSASCEFQRDNSTKDRALADSIKCVARLIRRFARGWFARGRQQRRSNRPAS